MEADVNEAVMQLARALSNPARLRIAALLVESECSLDQIASALKLRPQDVSRHLKLLREGGLAVERIENGMSRYTLDLNELRRISRAAFANPQETNPELDGDSSDAKVLRNFTRDGRLTTIPASHKKKLVVLRWLAARIPSEVRLPEREISTLLAQYHPDFATLRRELVDNGFLMRDRGVYWRPVTDDSSGH